MYQTMLLHIAPFCAQRTEQLYRFSVEGVSYMTLNRFSVLDLSAGLVYAAYGF
ncbi:unnamed protein product [marine sediment metagenome]|uniref:Uncharacterized protein n=1 Tax=marine sediment metagenome TaxID=412755 RepID=X0TKB5_9ZZZZ